MGLIGYLLAAIAALGAWLYFEHSTRKHAEALNDNLETKEKVDAVNKDVIKNEALIEAEKQKQDELNKNLEEEKKKEVSKDELLDFFNKDEK